VKARERELINAHKKAVDALAKTKHGSPEGFRAARKVESAWRALSAWRELEKYRTLCGDPLVAACVDDAADVDPRGEPVPVVGDLLPDLDCTTTQTAPGHAACLANAYILHASNCTL
jgi:hypothetical protein